MYFIFLVFGDNVEKSKKGVYNNECRYSKEDLICLKKKILKEWLLMETMLQPMYHTLSQK